MTFSLENGSVGTKVPAVATAIALLRLLQARRGRPARLSELADALGANRSTCFNILKTLQSEGFVAYSGETKAYRLGPALLELGLSVGRDLDVISVALPYAQALVRDIEFAVLLVRRLADGRFMVADKVESLKDIKVTIAVGETFPANAPLLARCHLAWSTEEEVDAFIARHGLTRFTPTTVTDPEQFKAELAEVREVGYAVSRGEYYLRNNAVASPVFGPDGRVTLILSTLGFSSDLTDAHIPVYGQKLAAAAAQVTRAMGGQPPRPRLADAEAEAERGPLVVLN